MEASRFQFICLMIVGAVARPASRFPLRRSHRTQPAAGISELSLRDGAMLPMDSMAEVASPPALNLIAARRTLANTQGDFYTLEVRIGSPPRSARLIIDTGSSDLWIDQSKVHGLKNSSTAVRQGRHVDLVYGKGEASGVAYTDRLCLAEDPRTKAGRQRLCVEHQSYVLADDAHGLTKATTFDGMLGLGFAANKVAPGKTFLQEMEVSNFATNPVFGITLSPSNSFITFGDLEDVKAEAPQGSNSSVTVPLYAFADEKNFPWGFLSTHRISAGTTAIRWMFRMSVGFGSGNQYTELNSINGVVDSGASLLVVPEYQGVYFTTSLRLLSKDYHGEKVDTDEQFSAMVDQLSAHKCATRVQNTNIVCLCDIDLQPLTFTFDDEEGKTLSLSLGSSDLLTPIGEDSGQQLCRIDILRGALFQSGIVWTLGDVFLRRAYVIMDGRSNTITMFPTPGNTSVARPVATSHGTLRIIGMTCVVLLIALLVGRRVLGRRSSSGRCRCSANGLVTDSSPPYSMIVA